MIQPEWAAVLCGTAICIGELRESAFDALGAGSGANDGGGSTASSRRGSRAAAGAGAADCGATLMTGIDGFSASVGFGDIGMPRSCGAPCSPTAPCAIRASPPSGQGASAATTCGEAAGGG